MINSRKNENTKMATCFILLVKFIFFMMDAIIVISKKAFRIIGSEILLAIDGNPLMIPLIWRG